MESRLWYHAPGPGTEGSLTAAERSVNDVKGRFHQAFLRESER